MGGPNGQMSGPIGGMSHMPPGNMMQSYQGWGTPPASTAYPGKAFDCIASFYRYSFPE